MFIVQASGEPSGGSPMIVLKPKLRAPVPRPDQLVRRELLELLHDALECRVSVVSAPTGYGKTTLLAHWRRVEEADHPFAWVSLDEQDEDPIRLWRHVVEALRRVVPEEDFGADVLVGMGAVRRGFVETTLPTLINELAELPHRIVLVLDDYQHVSAGDANGSVAYFLEHLPDNVHLVVSGRSDPPLPLGRLRARGELNEIRTRQLAFTEEEIACLLNERMGVGIEPDDISVLFERTEGWPAGIYLASLSLRDKEDKHAFIKSFGGSNRYIVGLLGEEVLAGLDEEVRRFLLETSVLRRMTGPLCDAVTGRGGSASLLRGLANSNLFVVALDEQDEWYRYHHLFSELLLYELRSAEPDLVPALRGRASDWLEGEGYVEGAIRQASEAGDYKHVGLLIARHWYGYAFSGQTATVERWLASLPEGAIVRDAALCLVRAWLCALGGRPEESARFLALAEGVSHEGPLPDGTASVESGAAVLRATFGFGGVTSAVEDAQRAARLEPERSPWAAFVRFALGTGLYLSGETSLARKPLEGALELTAMRNQPLLEIAFQSWLSLVAADEGRSEEAESRARAASALVDRFRLQAVPQANLASIALGHALAERGKPGEAREELERAYSARRRMPGLSPWPMLVLLLTLAGVRAARGDRAGGRRALAEAREILEHNPDSGVFPELVERQERKLRTRRPREGQLDVELTERELEVLRLLDGELTTRQMAERLYVAPSTVRTQVKSIYRKLGVSSREQAVDEARNRGLI
ncbi:MAG TPA: LuxR C-terminal-related transcriptional regulator [Rubrobacter sp.]|nr:LuxR C-terminal-related transcriptional regulator [Rubrobacter sp.]